MADDEDRECQKETPTRRVFLRAGLSSIGGAAFVGVSLLALDDTPASACCGGCEGCEGGCEGCDPCETCEACEGGCEGCDPCEACEICETCEACDACDGGG